MRFKSKQIRRNRQNDEMMPRVRQLIPCSSLTPSPHRAENARTVASPVSEGALADTYKNIFPDRKKSMREFKFGKTNLTNNGTVCVWLVLLCLLIRFHFVYRADLCTSIKLYTAHYTSGTRTGTYRVKYLLCTTLEQLMFWSSFNRRTTWHLAHFTRAFCLVKETD